MFEPVKVAFGRFLGDWHASLVPTTRGMQEYVLREYSQAVKIAKSRMVDAAEDMLGAYLRDEQNKSTAPRAMPIVIVAVAGDYSPTARDYTHQVVDWSPVVLPDDPKERVFEHLAAAGDLRAQVVFAAHDEPTARALAAQFCLFLDAAPNRYFMSTYRFAGVNSQWPVSIESPEVPCIKVQTEASNLCVLAADLTLRVTAPLFRAPKPGEPNDGKGVPGTDDPAGYPLVIDAVVTKLEPPR